MLFNSVQFLIFFLITLTAFFALPTRWKNPFLLVASYYFYMCWSTKYIFVIWAITLVDFWAGLLIQRAETRLHRRILLGLSIASNFGLLFFLKYADFFSGTANTLAQKFGLPFHIPALNLLLPVGISFHTFQAVSYTIEVYRRRVPAETNLVKYGLYVAIFPQMVAGPIERPYNLLPQLSPEKSLRFENFRSGLQTALWGLFKKVVIADTISPAVTAVYDSPHSSPGPVLALITVLFSIQIYCDFSGYSDIAIGIARMMGYDLMINFRTPYLARSLGEFWHRWHISLSTWFRDYLYIPLGGSRVSQWHWYLNLMIVFTVSGLWHGASWTFVLWGGMHGFYLVFGSLTEQLRSRVRAAVGLTDRPRLNTALQTIVTFILVSLAWVFFRANSPGDALYILGHIFRPEAFHISSLFGLGGISRFEWTILVAAIATLIGVEWLMSAKPPSILRAWSAQPFRWATYYACAFSIIFFGVFDHIQFIYFQF